MQLNSASPLRAPMRLAATPMNSRDWLRRTHAAWRQSLTFLQSRASKFTGQRAPLDGEVSPRTACLGRPHLTGAFLPHSVMSSRNATEHAVFRRHGRRLAFRRLDGALTRRVQSAKAVTCAVTETLRPPRLLVWQIYRAAQCSKPDSIDEISAASSDREGV